MMGTKRNCGGDSDHIQAMMNGSNLALEWIMTLWQVNGEMELVGEVFQGG